MHKPVNPTSLLLLTLLLIAACWQNSAAQNIPAPQHQSRRSQNQASGQNQSPPATDKMPPGMDMPGMDPGMPGMNMGDADKSSDNHAESGAMRSMQPGHHMDGAHMRMTPMRPATPNLNLARADQIAAALRQSIEPYRDYRAALAEGYKIFMPNLPQAVYRFTNSRNGFLEGFTFDPARPTSLLYKKTKDGY